MKQTAYEVNMRAAEGYWRICRFREAVERARRAVHERICSRIVKEAKALDQDKR